MSESVQSSTRLLAFAAAMFAFILIHAAQLAHAACSGQPCPTPGHCRSEFGFCDFGPGE